MEDYNYYDDDDFEEMISGDSSKKFSAIVPVSKSEAKKKHKLVAKGRPPKGTLYNEHILSAKDREVNELKNQLSETKRILKEIEKENKILKRLQVRQEKELTHISQQQNELPAILQKHSNEARMLTQQVKQAQQNNAELQRKLLEANKKIVESNDRKKELNDLVKKRHLKEREELTMQLQDTHEIIRQKDMKISEKERLHDLKLKSHNQELKVVVTKNKQLAKELKVAKEDAKILRWQLKEKERQLDIANIYSQRVSLNAPPTLPPLPFTDEKGVQTTLSHPPQADIEMIKKRSLVVHETQTDSSWLTTIMKQTPQLKEVDVGGRGTPSSFQPPSIATSKTKLSTIPPVSSVATSVPYSMGTNVPTTTLPQPVSFSSKTPTTMSSSVVQPISTVSSSIPPPTSSIAPTRPPNALSSITPSSSNVVPAQRTPIMSASQEPDEDAPLMSINPVKLDTPKSTDIKAILFGDKGEHSPIQPSLQADNVGISPPQPRRRQETTGTLDAKQKDDLLKLFSNDTSNSSSDRAPVRKTSNDELLSKLFPSSTASNNAQTISSKPTSTQAQSRPTAANSDDLFGRLFPAHTSSSKDQPADQSKVSTGATKTSDNLMENLFPSQTETKSVPEHEDSKLSLNSTTSLTRSERIRNMHQGLPAMASEHDKYGTKLTRGPSNKSLVGEPSSSTRSNNSIKNRQQPIFGSLDDDSTKPPNVNPSFGGVRDGKRAQGSKIEAYPWEVPVHLDNQREPGNSNVQPTLNGVIQNSKHYVLDDDIEEVII